MQKKVLFDTNDPRGHNHFAMEFCKLLIENPEYFKEVESILDPNAFHRDFYSQVAIGKMKDLYFHKGAVMRYKDLYVWIENSNLLDIEKLEMTAWLEKIENSTMDENDVANVKALFECLSVYNLVNAIGITAMGSCKEGFKSFAHLERVADDVLKLSEKLKKAVDEYSRVQTKKDSWINQ